MKSLEFRIWSRSFSKEEPGPNKYEYLKKVRDQMRKIRSIRLDKNFKVKYQTKLIQSDTESSV